jgi:nickel/cobalt transporter (NiCoT) family protein
MTSQYKHHTVGVTVRRVLKASFRLFDDLPGRYRTKTLALYALLAAANVLSWAWAFLLFHDRPALLGTALLAYVFGLRHAVDADHIAAIDNAVRKLMQEDKRPVSAGFFFALGHSTIVIAASLAIALTATAFEGGPLKALGAQIGAAISALFLLGIGLINLLILKGVWRAFRRARADSGSSFDAPPAGGGFLARLCGPLFRAISRSWHMYPLGALFGLGFDTATEIGLLSISAAQAAQGLPLWSVLLFPALFTAGMALVDTTDSVLMSEAYGWAFVDPLRKLWYNLTITAASVAVALFVGGIEAAGLIADKFELDGCVWRAAANLNADLTNFGFVVIGIFALSWIASAAVYRWHRYGDLAPAAQPPIRN